MGFATMTANAAGPVMTLYLSAAGIEKRRFVGTSAWFFLIVNLVKVPFSIALGLLHGDDVVRAAVLSPAVLVGGLLGYATVRLISQRAFDVGGAPRLVPGRRRPSCSPARPDGECDVLAAQARGRRSTA